MNAQQLGRYIKKQKKHAQHPHALLFVAWCEAAAEYQHIGSGAALARCNAARIAWYDAVYGGMPPVKQAEPVDWQAAMRVPL